MESTANITGSEKEHGSIGIEALNVYCGLAYIPVRAIFEGRGLDLGRLGNLMMEKRSIGFPFEDPVTNAVNAAMPIIEGLDADERNRIEIVITSSESGVDYSKSITSYVHEYTGLSRNCRLIEVKQACYAATAALQMAVAYVASGISPGSKVLVIATDVSLVNQRAGYSEPVMGTGAVAILIGDQARVMAVDLGAFGNYSFETMDSARPSPEFDIADVDRSLFAYLDCLSHSFEEYRSKVNGVDFVETFDYLALHTPFAGLVKAAHRKMMKEFANASPQQVDQDFTQRVKPSLEYPSVVGNLCSGSVYLALASIIDCIQHTGTSRVGLFSYGSGCSSEFFSGVIDRDSAAAQARFGVGAHLQSRFELTFEEYTGLLQENLCCLRPVENREVDVERYGWLVERAGRKADMLVLTGVKKFHRQYKWTSIFDITSQDSKPIQRRIEPWVVEKDVGQVQTGLR
jgi:polyketide biosynthesis 3-hydroxy-3-methylglutaryl-CoA synthase-like enzyme PksG